MKPHSSWTDSLIAKFRRPPLSGLAGHQGERNCWVTGYPISGNSYVAYVIAYVLNCKYWDVDGKEWSPQRVPLIKYLCGENEHPSSQQCDWVLKTHGHPSILPIGSDDKVIYIVRNVHDVANSYFHRVEKTWYGSPSWRRRALSRLSKTLIPFQTRYRMAIRYYSRRWASQVQEVLDTPDVPILKYEQFMQSPLETLERIIMYVDPASWNKDIASQALETFSLKNMKAAAQQADTSDANRTDRVGGSGDYKKYFRPADHEWFDQQYSQLLAEIDSRASFGPVDTAQR